MSNKMNSSELRLKYCLDRCQDWQNGLNFNKTHMVYLFNSLHKHYPDARSELLEPIKDDPIDVLVATILSQATNDILSKRAFLNLKSKYFCWNEVLNEESGKIEAVLACGGLQRQKTKQIKGALRKVKDDFGNFTLKPLVNWSKQKGMEYLMSLPGVGSKTAACVMAFGLDKPTFPVDTHVFRITKRIGMAGEKQSISSVQNMFEETVPDELKMLLHLMLIHHGRKVCSARNPKCGLCFLQKLCRYFQNTNSSS